jgi:glyoxylate carboligase
MAKKKVADLLVDVLGQAGVRQIYGLPGDSLNGITDSIRKQKQIQWIHVRHEETAAFAAGAEAHLKGKLAVCAGSCGPGAEQVKGFSLFTVKAVLSGRGDEVVDLARINLFRQFAAKSR